VVRPPESAINSQVRKMDNGYRSQTSGSTGDISQIPGERLSPHSSSGESSPNTVEYYRGNLRRFLPYGEQQAWSDDIRLLTSGICVSKAASACVGSSGTWSYVSKIPFEAIPIGDDIVQIDG